MPFEKVETQVDFPAQERAVLEFWERSRAFEKLREKNRGKPHWSFLDGPITANNPMGVHHAWGRTYKDAYQRYFAMTGHELRYQNGFDCQGLWVEVEVEKELKLQVEARHREPGPRRPLRQHRPASCSCARSAWTSSPACRPSSRSASATGWTGTATRTGRSRPDERRSYFTMSEENNYTIWSFLKKCHERGLIYRGYDAMPWCPRCGSASARWRCTRAISWSPTGPCSCASRCASRPGENLLVWTTTPWTLTSNVAAAVNPELTYLKVKHKDQIYYLAKGAFTAQRLEEQFKQKEWVEGVPKLKTLEQIFKEKGGYEIVGEVQGADMVGWQYDGPFDELPAQQHPAGYPARDRRGRAASRAGRRRSRPASSIASSPGTTSARPRAPASSTSPRAAARRTSSSARREARRRSRRSTTPASSCPASARWKASRPSTTRRPTGSSTTCKRRACCSRSRSIRTAIRTAGAARRSCCSASSTSGSST